MTNQSFAEGKKYFLTWRCWWMNYGCIKFFLLMEDIRQEKCNQNYSHVRMHLKSIKKNMWECAHACEQCLRSHTHISSNHCKKIWSSLFFLIITCFDNFLTWMYAHIKCSCKVVIRVRKETENVNKARFEKKWMSDQRSFWEDASGKNKKTLLVLSQVTR